MRQVRRRYENITLLIAQQLVAAEQLQQTSIFAYVIRKRNKFSVPGPIRHSKGGGSETKQ